MRTRGGGVASLIRRTPAPACILFLTLIAMSCSGGDSVPASDVVETVPWTDSGIREVFVYNVVDKSGAVLGKETLSIDTSGSDTRLRQLFESDTNKDDGEVVVDSRTLQPKSSTRTIVTPSDTETIEAQYTPAGVEIKQGGKQSGLSVPEHSYDNDTSLFLWRTLPFADGYEGAYVTIITNRRTRQNVTLRVVGKETVTVPAGKIEAWRLEIKTSNAKQTAWYSTNGHHFLVKYDNDNGLIFELQALPPIS